MGGNTNGNTLLVDHNNTTLRGNQSILSNTPTTTVEDDVTYLNIRENMNDGKSLTWFRYGTLLVDELNLEIDFVLKVDSDTLLVPPLFLNWTRHQVHSRTQATKQQYYPERVYGGVPFPRSECGRCRHVLTANDFYMNGGFYFLSMDLARYLTAPESPFWDMTDTNNEDICTAQLVHLYPQQPLDVWAVGPEDRAAFCYHPVKRSFLWDRYWNIKAKRMNEQIDDDAMYYMVTGKHPNVVDEASSVAGEASSWL